MFDNNLGKCGPIFQKKILQLIRNKILHICMTRISKKIFENGYIPMHCGSPVVV